MRRATTVLDAVVTRDGLGAAFTWVDAPLWALRYDCFLGDIRFVVDDVDFSTHWGWVPVLDFALGMATSSNGLVSGQDQVFEFTESEATIRMKRVESAVELTASYSARTMTVELEELSSSSRDFVRRLSARLLSRHPDLRLNPEFQQALRSFGPE